MTKINKFILISLIIVSIFLSGCSNVVKSEYQDVKVKVVDVYHQGMSLYRVGGVTMYKPSQHEVTVEYDGEVYKFNNKYFYNKYKDKIGEDVDAVLNIVVYDNGNIEKNITELK